MKLVRDPITCEGTTMMITLTESAYRTGLTMALAALACAIAELLYTLALDGRLKRCLGFLRGVPERLRGLTQRLLDRYPDLLPGWRRRRRLRRLKEFGGWREPWWGSWRRREAWRQAWRGKGR